MTFLYIMLLFVAIVVGGLLERRHLRNRSFKKKYGISAKDYNALSWPARQLIVEYFELPAANRPDISIVNVVKALDTKYGVDEATVCYSTIDAKWVNGQRRRFYVHGWEHHTRMNKMSEYSDIHYGLAGVKKALADQEYQMSVSRVSHSLKEAHELTERLRAERDLINDVTKELM